MSRFLSIMLVLQVCAGGLVRGSGHAPVPAESRSAIYSRATNSFARVEFFKPREPSAESLAYTLAPLLLQETRGADEPSKAGDPFGAIEVDGRGLRVDSSKPTVYFEPGTCVLNGRAHATMTYLWFYSAEPGSTKPKRLSAQGVRLTLDSAGKPGIWEVLADLSRSEIIFVAQSVEAAALAQYGNPLPGRQFAVERGAGEEPNVVVARVIDDGPVAMGPILYLMAPSRGVSTLICRCMPAQARQIARTTDYDLVNSDLIAPFIGRAGGAASLKNPTLPHFENSAEVLEKRLRLPDSF